MGVVYRARDPILNRDVAVKVIGSAELTAEIEERFQLRQQGSPPKKNGERAEAHSP